MNESLCPDYWKLIGKCNRLLKKNLLKSFYTINGKLKIKYNWDDGEFSAVITHGEDMLEVFRIEIMSTVESE